MKTIFNLLLAAAAAVVCITQAKPQFHELSNYSFEQYVTVSVAHAR